MRDVVLNDVALAENVLFPPPAERLFWNGRLTNALANTEQRVSDGPVTPNFDVGAFKAELAAYDFCEPVAFGDLLDWTVASLETGLIHVNHPKYLGLFNPAPSFPAQCADRIVSSFNPQLASATTSPAAVEIEAHVISAVARRARLGANASGHFTSGGSEANFTALICALTRIEPAYAAIGSRAFPGQPVFYISQDSHLAWIKIAHQAGIGRLGARLVPTDGAGRMSLDALEAAIEADCAADAVPVMVVATAGTTNAGMIDPLIKCAEVVRRRGLWYHVDAAWGGAAIASEALRHHLAGMEQADSITIDAHKWFATTMGCGMFLTAHAPILSAAFNVVTSFMPSHTPTIDPYVTTAQWSRRFVGLRLFMSLAAAGWAGHAAHVERCVALVQRLVEAMESYGWSALNKSTLGVACLLPPSGSKPVGGIVQHVLASGRAWISAACFEGQDVIRACVTNGETTYEDIEIVAQTLEQARFADLRS